jgi:hypothetical protein
MLYNNINKVIQMIPLFSREGTQIILSGERAKCLIDMIDIKDLENPATTYQDVQCGTGFIMLMLAERLMSTLAKAIPDEQDRLKNIFQNQLFLSDIDSTQTRIARANLLRAIGNRTFSINVEQADCFKLQRKTTYTLGSIDFGTTNNFVPFYRNLSEEVIIVTRANKHSYESNRINDIYTYRYLGVSQQSSVPLCIMHFSRTKKTNDVRFTDGTRYVNITNPTFLPGEDLDGYLYASEVLALGLEGYKANYGTLSRETCRASSGSQLVIFGVGTKESDYGQEFRVSKKIVSDKDGLGVHKLVVSKNGNRGQKSIIKYASPDVALGHTTLWIELTDPKDFKKINKVWEKEPAYDKLIRILKETSPANGLDFWSSVPNIKNLKQIKQIYAKHYESSNN